MSCLFLTVAGLLEIGWPVGLKWAQEHATRLFGIAIALFFMALSENFSLARSKKFPSVRHVLCG